MKNIRFNVRTFDDPTCYLVQTVSHDCLAENTWRTSPPPILQLTFFAQYLVKGEMPTNVARAIEIKLSAVRLWQSLLTNWVNTKSDDTNISIADYDYTLVACLEAYCSAIYTLLEANALLNAKLHSQLPVGFRRQSHRDERFSFVAWPWLQPFYHLRTALVHYTTVVPTYSDAGWTIALEDNLNPDAARAMFELRDVMDYANQLSAMLNGWAESELNSADQNTIVSVVVEIAGVDTVGLVKVSIGELRQLALQLKDEGA